MLQVKAVDSHWAEVLMACRWPTHVVSLVSGDVPAWHGPHLHVRIDDILRPTAGMILPEPEHVAEVLAFTQPLRATDRLLIHCQHGRNRSPALAIAVLIQHGVSFREAYDVVRKQCPWMQPNRLLMRYVDQYFNPDLSG